jgi:phage terminase large subunit-like protein
MLLAWHEGPVAPWQTEAWVAQMRQQLRPNAYLRMIENRFVSSESGFVDLAWWDACTSPDVRPVVIDRALSVYVGVDASTKRDTTAVAVVRWNASTQKVRVVWHRIFRPSLEDPLDFERTIEATLLELRTRFVVRRVRFDPMQMASPAQRLTAAGVPMEEYPQTLDRLTAMGSNLYELVKHQNLEVYADEELRRAIGMTVAKEVPGRGGWKIAKEKSSAKIDIVVALAMAALAAVEGQTQAGPVVAPIALLKPQGSVWARIDGRPAEVPEYWAADPAQPNDGYGGGRKGFRW